MSFKLKKAIAADVELVLFKSKKTSSNISYAEYKRKGGVFSELQVKQAGGWAEILDFLGPSPLEKRQNEIIAKKTIEKAEKQLNSLAIADIVAEKIKSSFKNMPKYPHIKSHFSKNKGKIDRALTVVLSDHHIGSDIDPQETGGIKYTSIEEARALALVTEQVCSYKLDKRKDTVLNVLMLGDMIENELHGRTSADLVHLQACRAIWLYPQVLGHFAKNFKEVNVYFAVGNHGRDPLFHPDRATALKYNSLETTIYYAIRQAMANVPNIKFYQPKTPWVDFYIFKHRIYATHGDTHLKIGNPGKSINMAKIEAQINKINSSLKDTEEYKAFVMGHVHQPLVAQLNNKSYLILNGALVPPNSYAQTLDIVESPQAQLMWESTPDHVVGDFRIISITQEDLELQSLEKIIKPFKGF